MQAIREDWFPSSIWHFQLEQSDQLDVQLLLLIVQERECNPCGLSDRSTVLGWHSGLDLHQWPQCGLLSVIRQGVKEVARLQRSDLDRRDAVVLNCWANINGKFAGDGAHNHPNALLSGIYHVQANARSGDLVFRDPCEGAVLLSPPT